MKIITTEIRHCDPERNEGEAIQSNRGLLRRPDVTSGLLAMTIGFTFFLFTFTFFAFPASAASCRCSCEIGEEGRGGRVVPIGIISDGATVDAPTLCNQRCFAEAGEESFAPSCEPVESGAVTPTRIPRLVSPITAGTAQQFIGNAIKGALGVIGAIALLMFVYGGSLYLTSSGNSEKIELGKKTLAWAAIGLLVVFAAYTLVNFVITSLSF